MNLNIKIPIVSKIGWKWKETLNGSVVDRCPSWSHYICQWIHLYATLFHHLHLLTYGHMFRFVCYEGGFHSDSVHRCHVLLPDIGRNWALGRQNYPAPLTPCCCVVKHNYCDNERHAPLNVRMGGIRTHDLPISEPSF